MCWCRGGLLRARETHAAWPTPCKGHAIAEQQALIPATARLQDWTSFDVCGKLRGALAALLKKKHREIKVGHAGGWGKDARCQVTGRLS